MLRNECCAGYWLAGPVNPANPVKNFPLAVQSSCVSRVKFTGDGVFTSLLGEWSEPEKGMRILIR